MEYVAINKFEEVDAFFTPGKKAAFLFSRGTVKKLVDGQTIEWESKFPTNWNLARLNDKVIYSSTQYQRIVLINEQSGSIINDFLINFKPIRALGNHLFGNYLKENEQGEGEFYFGEFSPEQPERILFKTQDYAGIEFSDPYLVCQCGYTKFRCYKSGVLIWDIDFSEIIQNPGIEVPENPVLKDDKIFFFISDFAGLSATYILDIETGIMLHHNDRFAGHYKVYNNKLIIASDVKVELLDTATFETAVIDFSSILNPAGIGIEWNIFEIKGNNLFFSNNKRPGIGVLDIDNIELLWYIDLEVNIDNLKKVLSLAVDDNLLFAHCSDKKLHIFHR